MKFVIGVGVAMFFLAGVEARADVIVKWLKPTNFSADRSVTVSARFETELLKRLPLQEAREVRLQSLPERAVEVQVLSRAYHRFDRFEAKLDARGELMALNPAKTLPPSEPLIARCPDREVQFIAFAPNDDELEQSTTEEVAKAAERAGLKTVRLYKADATRVNYVNYMACPLLKGNFYDGDADPTAIVTVDGILTSEDLAQNLSGAFRYSVTNIWLACQAYNNPMLGTMIKTVQSQKYAAGRNNLLVGPSDRTGACAMERALEGQPMAESFTSCYKEFDSNQDKWGFGGKGSNYFGD